MNSKIHRLICLFVFAGVVSFLSAQPVSRDASIKQALAFFMDHHNNPENMAAEALMHENETVAWLILNPDNRWAIVSADGALKPILAYGHDISELSAEEYDLWKSILASDYYGRIQSVREKIPAPDDRHKVTKTSVAILFEQWPPEGTTPTGGWLFTNWTQSYPYNMVCPIDLNTGNRSVAGCPATAMAQIFNYHRTVNYTRFDDSDDYYHSYGANNQYYIDDDFAARGFLSFPALNRHLDSLQHYYNVGSAPTDSMKAALTFAAGVAARQVYTSSVSGTFGLSQAYAGIIRFGFDLAKHLLANDPDLNNHIAENMKNALPVQLGLLVPNNGGGHNVVVDGYNTDEYYHFNFGWGGSANGWYTLPPTSIPYNLTIVEGAVVDILSSSVGIANPAGRCSLPIFRGSPDGYLWIEVPEPGVDYTLDIYSVQGQFVKSIRLNPAGPVQSIKLTGIAAGIYFLRLTGGKKTFTGKAFMKE
jgi:hypothetical protein